MEKIQAFLKVSFGTKVLMPVVASMVALLMLTVWLVNRRISQQFQTEASRSLATAEAVLKRSQTRHRNELWLRYRNLPKEPRYKAALQSGDQQTIEDEIKDLTSEQDVDVALFTSGDGEALANARRDPLLPIAEFVASSSNAVGQALSGEGRVDTVRVGDRLFDIVSIPVAGTSDHLVGVLTFGSEIGNSTAEQLRDFPQCQLVLLAGDQVIASTFGHVELNTQFAHLFNQSIAGSVSKVRPREVAFGEEHYFCTADKFPSLGGNNSLGYLLLYSFDQPLHALRNTQQMLLAISAVGILFGTAIVWFLIRKVTQPLRDLRDSAEAVGKGDYSRRVEVVSGDECGELAWVFNQMTENVKRSREQLESTVETLKTTQAQLVQSEKLSGIGEFVAGVAHELNNPLTSVMGFSELLSRSDAMPQHKRHLDMIQKSAVRCQKIVQSLLSFSRRHAPERKLSSINELIESAIEFLHYQLRTSNIEVISNLQPDLPRTMVDPHQLQQVFLNIINNGRQAMEAHQPSGCIRITTEMCGHNIRVVFHDNGPGIPEANLSKVFDPFFTTKELGKGTGLGLSLCYGLIKEHGGSIVVRSKPGDGATFVVELPLVRDALEQEAKPATAASRPSSEQEGLGKKVLIIDDEEAILEMVRETLSVHGYEVDTARDGETALDRLHHNRYDLALCDWKMPGLNGQQVYERLRVSDPVLSERLIFITGDVINDKTQSFLQERKKQCLSKPFSLVEFRAAIEQALLS